MILEKSMHEGWLSNSWLVGDRPGGHAVLIDSGGPIAPIRRVIEEQRLTLTHVLCTHHHYDHVAHNADYRSEHGCPICGGRKERELFDGRLDIEIDDGDALESGELRIRALSIPGHTSGQLAFLVGDDKVFTGDTLFRSSIGSTRAPGHTSYEDIRHSIMAVLMNLPRDTAVYPGHMEPTTIGREWDTNPFIRYWRGADCRLERRCTAFGEPAALLVEARDYDGGTKCEVRFDDGRIDIVPGSRVSQA